MGLRFLSEHGQLDFTDPALQELRALLSTTYDLRPQVISMVRDVGGAVAEINWEQPMSVVWNEVLIRLANQGKLVGFLDRIAHGIDTQVGVRVAELTADRPVVAAPQTPLADPPAGAADPGGFEKIIQDTSTLLDIAFLRRGIELAPAVVRLLVTLDGDGYFGTGFRIGPDLFLTNHHVLFAKSGAPATKVEAWFGYERAFGGDTLAHVSLHGDPNTIVGDQAHDWAVVRLLGAIPDGVPVIALTDSASVRAEDRVYIIQHPQGGVKKIGMVHNVVRDVGNDVISYWTDTEEGSSGSPVFNEDWQVVALHHYWTRVRTGSTVEIRNQGIRIERVVEGLSEAGLAIS